MKMVKKMMFLFMLMTMVAKATLAVGELSWRQEVHRDCNVMCECVPRSKHETYVTCRPRGDSPGLSYVPYLHPTTVRLDMSHNNLGHVTQDTFTNVNANRVRWLRMRNCSIAIIDENAFVYFEKHLTHLDLSQNALNDTKLLISGLSRMKKLIYVNARKNPGIDCLELQRGLPHIDRNIQCDVSRIGRENRTTSPPPGTTSMIHLNHITSRVSVPSNSYYTTSPSPVVLPKPMSPNQTQHPVINDTDASPKGESVIGGIQIVAVIVIVIVAVIILYLMYRKPSSQPITETLTETDLPQDFYVRMASIQRIEEEPLDDMSYE